MEVGENVFCDGQGQKNRSWRAGTGLQDGEGMGRSF